MTGQVAAAACQCHARQDEAQRDSQTRSSEAPCRCGVGSVPTTGYGAGLRPYLARNRDLQYPAGWAASAPDWTAMGTCIVVGIHLCCPEIRKQVGNHRSGLPPVCTAVHRRPEHPSIRVAITIAGKTPHACASTKAAVKKFPATHEALLQGGMNNEEEEMVARQVWQEARLPVLTTCIASGVPVIRRDAAVIQSQPCHPGGPLWCNMLGPSSKETRGCEARMRRHHSEQTPSGVLYRRVRCDASCLLVIIHEIVAWHVSTEGKRSPSGRVIEDGLDCVRECRIEIPRPPTL